MLELNSVWNCTCYHELRHLALKRGAMLHVYWLPLPRRLSPHFLAGACYMCECSLEKGPHWSAARCMWCWPQWPMQFTQQYVANTSKTRVAIPDVHLSWRCFGCGTSIEAGTSWGLLGWLVWKHFRVHCGAMHWMHLVYLWEMLPSKPGKLCTSCCAACLMERAYTAAFIVKSA